MLTPDPIMAVLVVVLAVVAVAVAEVVVVAIGAYQRVVTVQVMVVVRLV